MKKTKILLLISIIAFALSCNNYDGAEIISYYQDSVPKIKVFYKYYGDKQFVAKEIRYFSNHQVESEGEYDQNGKRNGTWTYYFNNGDKNRIETYKNGVKNGKEVQWYKSGKKMYEGEYLNNLPNGTWTIWNEEGKKMETTKYDNGQIVK